MFVGIAHKNNRLSQNAIADERAIPILVDLMFDAPSKDVQVEVAYAISCIVLSNAENQERLAETPFHFNILLDLLESSKEVCSQVLEIGTFSSARIRYFLQYIFSTFSHTFYSTFYSCSFSNIFPSARKRHFL